MARRVMWLAVAWVSCAMNFAAGVIELLGPAAVVENAGPIEVSIVADPPPSERAYVAVMFSNATATAGEDFGDNVLILELSPFVRSLSFNVSILDDVRNEGDEEFLIHVVEVPEGYTLPPALRVRIVDDEATARAFVELVGPRVTRENAVWFDYEARLSAPLPQPTRVEWRLIDRTAIAGADFVAANGVLDFAENARTAAFRVYMANDAAFEPNETFIIELFNATPGVSIATPQTLVTIEDDDRGYGMHPTVHTTENAGVETVMVYRVGTYNFTTTVQARLETANAVAGVDFADEIYTAEFGPGQTLTSFPIRILNDGLEDGERQFRVVLTNPSDGLRIIPGAESTLVTVADNEFGYSLWDLLGGLTPSPVYEGGGEITLYRNGDYETPAEVTVSFEQANSDLYENAAPGVDFTQNGATVRFGQGERSARVAVPVIDDGLGEGPEVIGVSFPRLANGSQTVRGEILVRDNEYNPLPAEPLCLGGMAVVAMETWQNDRALLLLRNAEGEVRSTIMRMLAGGEIDPTFTPVTHAGEPVDLNVLEDGHLALTVRAAEGMRMRILRADGAADESFAEFAAAHIGAVAAAQNGDVFVAAILTEGGAHRIEKVKPNGAADPQFNSPAIFGTVNSILAAPDGGAYVTAQYSMQVEGVERTIVKLRGDGAVDPSFAPTVGVTRVASINGALYGIDSNSRLVRLTVEGEVDEAFAAIPRLWVKDFLTDAAGGFYRIAWSADGVFQVNRFTASGTEDQSYFRGTLWGAHITQAIVAGDDLFLMGAFTEVNGLAMRCGESQGVFNGAIRVALRPENPRLLVDPQATRFFENSTPASQIAIIRTGHNLNNGATGRYRVRSGSAEAGADFEMAPEGELSFAPGVSRLTLPLTIIDDAVAEQPETFRIDFLDANGAVASMSALTLFSNDLAFQILPSAEANERQLLATGLGATLFQLETSADLTTWTYAGLMQGETPKRIPIDGERRFFRIRVYAD